MKLVLLLAVGLVLAPVLVVATPVAAACTEEPCDPPPMPTGCELNDPVTFLHNWKRCL